MNREEIIKNYQEQLLAERQEKLSENSDLIESFISFCKSKKVLLKLEDFQYVQSIGIVAKHPNLVHLLNDKITTDKEELVSFDLLEKEFERHSFNSGYLYSDKYMVMAHSYFRRGHHEDSNFAPRFIDVFWHYINDKNKNYLAMDFDRVRINVDNSMYLEADTWHGAAFNENISEMEDGLVKLRPPQDLDNHIIDLLFKSTYSLDIKWYTKKGIKVFQAKEFKTESYRLKKDGKEYYPAKYLHAEFDPKDGFFRHLDGAIQLYTEDEYYLRRDSDFNYNQKNEKQVKALSKKLFKVNGNVSVKDWVELTSHYFTGDPLIIEYFEGEVPENINDMVETLRVHKNQ